MLIAAPDALRAHQHGTGATLTTITVAGISGAEVTLPAELVALLFDLDGASAALATKLARAGVTTTRELLEVPADAVQMIPGMGGFNRDRLVRHLRGRGVALGCLASRTAPHKPGAVDFLALAMQHKRRTQP